jgi:hypothetical protein
MLAGTVSDRKGWFIKFWKECKGKLSVLLKCEACIKLLVQWCKIFLACRCWLANGFTC